MIQFGIRFIYGKEITMKKITLIAVALLLTICIAAVGCSGGGGNAASTNDKAYLDLINKTEVGDSLEKITEIIGFEGEVQSDNATYVWEIGNGGFSAVFREGTTEEALSVKVLYDNDDVVNSKVKIKDLDTLKEKVSAGIHYDDFKEYLGGVDGVLVEKGPVTKGYVWRSSNGSVVTAAFKLESNICNSFVGTER